MSQPISRVLSRTIIHLQPVSPQACSGLPESNASHTSGFLFGLAPGGVYLAANCYQSRGALLPHLFTLTSKLAVYFLWHSPWACTLQALPGALSDGARTFLCNDERCSDCLADSDLLGGRILHLCKAHVRGIRYPFVEMARCAALCFGQMDTGHPLAPIF